MGVQQRAGRNWGLIAAGNFRPSFRPRKSGPNLPLRKQRRSRRVRRRRWRRVRSVAVVLSIPWPTPVQQPPINDRQPATVDVTRAGVTLPGIQVPLQTGKICRSNTTTDTSATIAIVTTLVERRVVLLL